MSETTDATLAYGFDLRGECDDLEFDGLGDYELPDWYDDEDPDSSFEDQARARLEAAGVDATGIEIVWHGSSEVPAYLLAAAVVTAGRGSVETITSLTPPVGADERLAAARAALGVTARNAAPAWLLVAYSD
jgi:hypothetical protein